MRNQLLAHPGIETILPSAAQTTTRTSALIGNHQARGALLTIVVTAVTLTPLLTPKVQYSPNDGATWIDYVVFTQVAPAGSANYSYMVHPDLVAAADGAITESVALPLPRAWRLVVTAADADSATYAAYAMYL